MCLLAAAVLAPAVARAATEAGAAAAVRFEADSDGSIVKLHWRVPPGVAVGFHVLRALDAKGPYAPINPWLIPARDDGAYAFSDLAVDPGATYHYQIEAVDPGGRKYLRGPLTIAVMPEETRVLDLPDGGGFPAAAAQGAGANAVGGCVAGAGGRWHDAAGLVLLLALALVRRAGRPTRVPRRRPMR